MSFHLPKNKNEIIQNLHDPLLKNSLFLIISSASSGVFGFVFWTVAAKFYLPSDVGIATALISSMGLILLFSRLGMDFSLIKFFPVLNKNSVFSTSVIITSVCTLIISLIYILGIDIFSPDLSFLNSPLNATLFVIYLIANSVTVIISNSFIAIRRSQHQLLQSLLMGSRIIFLIPFITFGPIGIFNAIGVSLILTMLISVHLIMKFNIKPIFIVDHMFLKETFTYSTANYIASIFTTAPNFILPVLVLNTLGAEAGAYYYISYVVFGLLFMIPNAISMSLFVEGSYGESLKKVIVKSLIVLLAFLLPISLILYIFANYILGLVGSNYASEGSDLFRLMIVASFFVSLNSISNSIQRVLKDMRGIIFINGLICVTIIGSGYLFMMKYGLVGIGYAWILSFFIGSTVFGVIFRKKQLSKML